MDFKKKLAVIIPALLLVIGLGAYVMLPSNSLTMDVNPSIQIETNRLDRVVSLKPLNLDAEQLLSKFNTKSTKLEDVVNDLVDLMILTGYIKGGDDNIVMISVEDDTVDSELLRRVNTAIKSFLENKQIEATILNQAIANSEEKVSPISGKAVVAEKMSTLGADLSLDELSNMTLKELIKYSKDNNIDIQRLFKVVTGDLDDTIKNTKIKTQKYISKEEAKKIALNLANGEITKLKLDDFNDDDDTPEYEIEIVKDGVKYEIEIDALTGKVKEFERDDDDHNHKKAQGNNQKSNNQNKNNHKSNNQKGNSQKSNNQQTNKQQTKKPQSNSRWISADEAKKIALGLVNGTIVEFEKDDDEYEIEIIKDGIEYEIEIDARTGKILEFEMDD